MRERLQQMGLMVPIDEELERRRRAAQPLQELRGAVAGFLDNRKSNADKLLARVRDVLHERFGFVDVVWRSKFIYSRMAAPEILDELAERCQFVVTAIGD
ncbi:MAG: hypothetical protein V3U27_07290 [Candidatus Tectomicrobia bacterium]